LYLNKQFMHCKSSKNEIGATLMLDPKPGEKL
jgi:hypothetical protein